MRIAAEWFTPTRISGITVQFLATTSCLIAWVKTRGDKKRSRLPGILTLLECVLLVDLIFDWRWKLYGLLRGEAASYHVYELRHRPQIATLIILCVLLLLAIAIGLKLLRGRVWTRLAFIGAVLSMGIWCTEIISLHASDALLYHRVGQAMVINFLWLAACLMTSIGILTDAYRRSSSQNVDLS